MTLQSSVTSKVDWWHGQSRWWVPALVQADGAAHVRADLGVGDDALVAPVELLLALDVTGIQAHEEDSCLGLLLEDAVLEVASRRPAGQQPSGRTWKTEPMVTSEALIAVFSGSRMRRIGVKAGSSPGPRTDRRSRR
jgi:hypothetical protein